MSKDKKWSIDINRNNRGMEILPTNDSEEHYPGVMCKCNPKITKLENDWVRITHNSFDGREAVEWANEIINPN